MGRFFSGGLGGCFFGGFSGSYFLCPVRVVNAKFVSADWVASLERFGTNAFFFSCNAELGISANMASVGDKNKLSV